MPSCTVTPCPNRHYAGGLCRSHYMKRMRARKAEETKALKATNPNPPTQVPTPPTKTVSGYVKNLPFLNDTPVDPLKIGIGEKGAPAPVPGGPAKTTTGYQFNIGIEYVEMGYEFLNSAAPNARIKLKLTEVQKANLEAAFSAVGIGTQNPWLVIVLTIVPPVVLFVILNYDELKLGLGKIFKDMRGAASSMVSKVKGVTAPVTGHPDGKPATTPG